MAESVASYFRQTTVRRLIEKFRQVGIDPVESPRAAGPFTGKTVVFTGTLTRFARAEASAWSGNGGGTPPRRCPAKPLLWSRGRRRLKTSKAPNAREIERLKAMRTKFLKRAGPRMNTAFPRMLLKSFWLVHG
jgi:hypothetical protein